MNFKYIIRRDRADVKRSEDFEKMRGFLKKLRANHKDIFTERYYNTDKLESCAFAATLRA